MKRTATANRFIPHPSSLIPSIWPDSGLTRNTRAPGYRCSVPGLAGFTGTTLCGARSLITCQYIADLRLPIADWSHHSLRAVGFEKSPG